MRLPGALLLCLAACADPGPRYLAQPERIVAEGGYVHPATGQAFPPLVAGFVRIDLAHYRTDMPDLAASYAIPAEARTISVTIFLRPAPVLLSVGQLPDAVARARDDACRREADRADQEFAYFHAANRLATHPVALNKDSVVREGALSVFAYSAMYHGVQQTLRTEIAFFCRAGAGWTMTFAFTYPEDVLAADPIARFMGALNWTGRFAGGDGRAS
jgi:hypothetical protein